MWYGNLAAGFSYVFWVIFFTLKNKLVFKKYYFSLYCGCCLIPLCIKSFKDVEHKCSKCKTHLGTRGRMPCEDPQQPSPPPPNFVISPNINITMPKNDSDNFYPHQNMKNVFNRNL